MMELWPTTGSSLTSWMFVWAIIRQYCPYEVRRFLDKYTSKIMSYFYPYIKISIHEFTGEQLKRSEVYGAVEAYLSINSSTNAKRLKAEMVNDCTKLVLSMEEYERVIDEYRGVKVWWVLNKGYCSEQEKRHYMLTFHKKYREIITHDYLEHVLKEGNEIRAKNRQRKLFTNSNGYKWSNYKQSMWSHIVFEHPATFETMAWDVDKKREIIEDLLTFSISKDFYARIGKAWKRGYLLYGPPGTGKSTMIAAIANLLNYDVYDLELTAVKDNTELRRLLIDTTSKSIIVIEDIDCSLDLTGQRKNRSSSEDNENNLIEESPSRVTLSGLLNLIDGIWSACAGERIVVFTTNYVEKLDPALTRRGRMDKHVELSYCSFEGFRILAKNYLMLETHPMFERVERLLKEVNITPADVAENLMPKSSSDDVEKRLSNLIQSLAAKREPIKNPQTEVEDNAEEEDGR
ncbi:hypothetical protein ACFE04_019052 [Oxalis oulophora]